MLIVPKKINWRSDYSGMDSLELCNDRQHFLNYKKKITYEYNSKGFRDHEWPTELNDLIWCVGDSFTVGIGQPFAETWPQLLEKKIGRRCINLGEDGCSNDTISLRVEKIYDLYKPKLIIVMWSYLHRRRIDNENVHSDKKDFGPKKDLENLNKNYQKISKLKTKIIQTIIPNILLDSQFNKKGIVNYLYNKFSNKFKILNFPQLDYARDYHHFDIKTSKHLVDLLIKKINEFDF